MQPVDFMVDLGLAFVVDWVILVGRVVGNGKYWYWLSSDIVGEDISKWDYKGQVEILATWEVQLQHEVPPPFSSRHSSQVPHYQDSQKQHN